MERRIYRLLSWYNWFKAARRGPAALFRRYERIKGYGLVNRVVGSSRPRRKR